MKNVLSALKLVVSKHPLLSTVLLVTTVFLLMNMCSGCNNSSSSTEEDLVVDGYYLISEGSGEYSDSLGEEAVEDIAGYYFTVSQVKDAVVVLGLLSKIDASGTVSFTDTVMNSYTMWGPITTTVSGSAAFDGQTVELNATQEDYYHMLDYTFTSKYTLKAALDNSVLEPSSGG